MVFVDHRRADIERLIRCALEEAYRRDREIETIDPLLKWARRLFPYLHEGTLNEYARTALRVIKNRYQLKRLKGRQMVLHDLFLEAEESSLES
ncbi:hypothetical protein KEJ49_03810 [Candidatus Bathyarchaeota archaeon]|nr:hypothetical protein [Candidatus Bathyarchaeota archaeon]